MKLWALFVLFLPLVLTASEIHELHEVVVHEGHLIPFMIPDLHKSLCRGKMVNGTKNKAQIYLDLNNVEPITLSTFGDLLQQAHIAGSRLEVGLISEVQERKRYTYIFAADQLEKWFSISTTNPETRKKVRSVLYFQHDPVTNKLNFKELRKYRQVPQQEELDDIDLLIFEQHLNALESAISERVMTEISTAQRRLETIRRDRRTARFLLVTASCIALTAIAGMVAGVAIGAVDNSSHCTQGFDAKGLWYNCTNGTAVYWGPV